MKKLLISTIVLLVTASVSKAQTEKGHSTLGLNLQYSHQSSESIYAGGIQQTQKYSNFYAGPDFSYFVADKLDLGAGVAYGRSKSHISSTGYSDGQQINKGYTAMVYLRKYIMYGDKIGIRTGPYLGYTKTTEDGLNTTSNGSNSTTTNSYNASLRLDVLFYPTKKLGVAVTMANAGYQHGKTTGDNIVSATADNVYFNFINNGLALSLFYTFGK